MFMFLRSIISVVFFFFSSRRRHTRSKRDWSSDVCSSDLFTGATEKQVGKFEQADRGTIFLDEVGDMSPKTQAKVLRVLQEGEVERLGSARTNKVDVRVIAATNKNLEEEIDKAHFREDLYFRLAVIPIHVPPLRERPEDIPLL